MAEGGSYFAKAFRRGKTRKRRYLRNVFNQEGAQKADRALTKMIGRGRELDGLTRTGMLAWGGGVALGVPHRLRQGDSLPKAMAKEAVRDAAYLAMPYLLPISAARGMAKMYPDMKMMSEAEREQAINTRTVGGGYQDTEANHASRARAMETIERSRMPQPGGEARRYHRTP